MEGKACPPGGPEGTERLRASTAGQGALGDGATVATATIRATARHVAPAARVPDNAHPRAAPGRAAGRDAIAGDVSRLEGGVAIAIHRHTVGAGARATLHAAIRAGHRGGAGFLVLNDGGLLPRGPLRRARGSGQGLPQDRGQNLVRDRTRGRRIGESSGRDQEEATGENPRLLHHLLLLCVFGHPIRLVLHKREGEPGDPTGGRVPPVEWAAEFSEPGRPWPRG